MVVPKDPKSVLKRQRGDIKKRMTRFRSFLASGKEDLELLIVKIDGLTENFKSLYVIHEELVALEETSDQEDAHAQELIAMEEEYHALLAEARRLIKSNAEKNAASQSSSRSGTSSNTAFNQNPPYSAVQQSIKLPEITLPKFDGSIEKWQAFRDKFLSRIDRNESIPAVDKLQYLQSTLTGKAARAIEAIEGTADNYVEAWRILIAKYDNSRKAILRHWSILHNLPRLQRDSPDALDELIDTFRQHLRALKSLGEPVEHWSSCIIYLVTTKISETTRYQWETTLPDNKMPNYTSLLDFLEKRGSCSEQTLTHARDVSVKTQKEMKFQTKGQVQTRGNSFVTAINQNRGNPACPVCHEAHLIFHCQTFRSMSINQRRQVVVKAALCQNCLGTGHKFKDCRGGSCRVCNGKHHTYLHPITTLPAPSNFQTPAQSVTEIGVSSNARQDPSSHS